MDKDPRTGESKPVSNLEPFVVGPKFRSELMATDFANTLDNYEKRKEEVTNTANGTLGYPCKTCDYSSVFYVATDNEGKTEFPAVEGGMRCFKSKIDPEVVLCEGIECNPVTCQNCMIAFDAPENDYPHQFWSKYDVVELESDE